MGHTIIEKIIGKNIGREVKPGDVYKRQAYQDGKE